MKKNYKLDAVIFDLAGTIIDFGSLATIDAMKEVFKKRQIKISTEIIKKHMGIKKIDHIKKITLHQKFKKEGNRLQRRNFTKKDLNSVSKDFDKSLVEKVKMKLNVIPNAKKIFRILRKKNILIGSTTGYPKRIIRLIKPFLKKRNILPKEIISVEDVKKGRPSAQMCNKILKKLKIKNPKNCLKIDDSFSGISEGKNAKMLTAGLIFTGIQIGMSKKRLGKISINEKIKKRKLISKEFKKLGCDFIFDDLYGLTKIIS